MNQTQRIAAQRALMREAFGKMEAARELFGVENEAQVDETMLQLEAFDEKLAEFREWMWEEGPLA